MKTCAALFAYGVFFGGRWAGVFVLIFVWLCLGGFFFVNDAAIGPQRLASPEPSWWAPVHCRQANMVGMSNVTEPGTEVHRWLTVIEGCPLSAAPLEQLTETVIPLTMIDEWSFYFFLDMIIDSVWLFSRILANFIFKLKFYLYCFILQHIVKERWCITNITDINCLLHSTHVWR